MCLDLVDKINILLFNFFDKYKVGDVLLWVINDVDIIN